MTNELKSIEQRNARVEADKAWETSWSRRLMIMIGTYVVVGLYLTYLGVEKSWFHAIVPATAYMLSTLTLPLGKVLWLKNIYSKDK